MKESSYILLCYVWLDVHGEKCNDNYCLSYCLLFALERGRRKVTIRSDLGIKAFMDSKGQKKKKKKRFG